MKPGEIVKDGPFAGFEVISVYSREQALDDGLLVDITHHAVRHGVLIPCAVTRAVWSVLDKDLLWIDGGKGGEILTAPSLEILSERIAAMLSDMKSALRRAPDDTDRVFFRALDTDLWSLVGPGDTAAPVMTIMLQGED